MHKEKARKSFITIVKNISFIIGYCCKNCKIRIIGIFVLALLSGINAANVILFYKYALESLRGDNPFFFITGYIINIFVYTAYKCYNEKLAIECKLSYMGYENKERNL